MPQPVCLDAHLDAGGFNPNNASDSLTLPAYWYTDPDVFALEQKQLFAKAWTYVGHVTDVPEAGDYFTAKVAGQSIFVIRNDAGSLQAFYNVCSHRAHPLLEGTGKQRMIVCPYHQWCYQKNGKFHGAKGHKNVADWLPNNANLKPVQVEEYAGLLFVNLDLLAPALSTQASELLAEIKGHCPELHHMRRAHRAVREVTANWKAIVDNNHECYHCHANHPDLVAMTEYGARANWRDHGITFIHKLKGYNRDSAPFTCEHPGEDSLFGFVFPTAIPLFFAGTGALVMFHIEPTGPQSSRIHHDFYFPPETSEAAKSDFIQYITKVLADEDMALCEAVQSGLNSNGYQQGKFVVDENNPGLSEHHVHFFQSLVYRALNRQ